MLDKTAPEALERTESDGGLEVENFDLPVEGHRGLSTVLRPNGWSAASLFSISWASSFSSPAFSTSTSSARD